MLSSRIFGRRVETGKPSNALEHERLITLVNSMADGVLATDETGIIVLSNGAALNILDINSTLTGQNLAGVFKPIDKNNQPVDVSTMLLTTSTPTTNRDLRLKYNDGSLINLYLSVAPVRLGFGGTGQRGYVLLLRDITHEKSLEQERDEFISVVSHELRTPIAAAEGNLSNVLMIGAKEHLPDDIAKATEAAYQQILFLGSLVNDLATLSRAERGKLNVDIVEVNVGELIDSLIGEHRPQADKKHLELRKELANDLQPLKSSRLYVREILQNFITNAIKYTETGSVIISAQAKPGGIIFEVKDTGIGISKGDQDKIFDKFFRSEDWRTRKNTGTGLGLYVTMKLARLVHAEIELESELNRGSVFKVTIPDLA